MTFTMSVSQFISSFQQSIVQYPIYKNGLREKKLIINSSIYYKHVFEKTFSYSIIKIDCTLFL